MRFWNKDTRWLNMAPQQEATPVTPNTRRQTAKVPNERWVTQRHAAQPASRDYGSKSDTGQAVVPRYALDYTICVSKWS
jgi:hypothetical protein